MTVSKNRRLKERVRRQPILFKRTDFVETVSDTLAFGRVGRAKWGWRRIVTDVGKKASKQEQCRSLLRRRGIKHQIPERADQKARRAKKGRSGGRPVVFEAAVYAQRNVVERCILRLKQWRRVATRYDKRASMYLAFVTLARIILWTR